MVLAFWMQSLHFGLIVIGIFHCLYSKCLTFLIIPSQGRNKIFLIGF